MYQFPIEEHQINTNDSFLSSNAGRLKELDFSKFMSSETLVDQHCQNVAVTMCDLIPNYSVGEKYHELTNIISCMLKNLNERERSNLRQGLKGHIGIYEDGTPWADLEAAWLLNFNDMKKRSIPKSLPNQPPLHNGIKIALSEGRHVPIRHTLHSLHLSKVNPELENYPLSFAQAIPEEFFKTIKRSDVFRAINIHAIFLGVNFPVIGAQFSGLLEYFWNFMFMKKYSALAGMELYDNIFFDFSCHLGRGTLTTLYNIPLSLKEMMKAKYKPA